MTGLTKLEQLILNSNSISDISALASLTNLNNLWLNNNKISDISPIALLTNLTTVALKGNELNSAAYAIDIPALEAKGISVQYDPGPVVTLKAFIPDDNLRAVLEEALGKGSGAPITELELADLTQLGASSKSITDLKGLELCTNLEVLYLGGNNISDISGLASLTNLRELSLYRTNISEISALASLTKLDNLNLKGN